MENEQTTRCQAADALADTLEKGCRVRFRKKGDALWESGMFQFAWWALDEIAFKIITDGGCQMDMLPAFGDEIEKTGV